MEDIGVTGGFRWKLVESVKLDWTLRMETERLTKRADALSVEGRRGRGRDHVRYGRSV